MNAHDVRREEVDRLAEHPRLGFDAAHSPGHDAQSVDHGGVGVGADERVGIPHSLLFQHSSGEVLEVDLMDDADSGRYDAESVEGLHPPLQELVALLIALELDVHVELERVGAIGVVDLHGVIDDEIDGHERLDDLRVGAGAAGGRAHRGQIDQQRHAGEVLQQHAGNHERDLVRPLGARLPVGQRADVLFGDLFAVDVAKDGFENDADRDRQLRHVADAGRFEFRKRVELSAAPAAEVEGIECIEGVVRHIHPLMRNGARKRRRLGPDYIKVIRARFLIGGRSRLG